MPLPLRTFWAPRTRCAALGRGVSTAPSSLSSPLQSLYSKAKKAFVDQGAAVTEQDVEELKQLLSAVPLQQLGLPQDRSKPAGLFSFGGRQNPSITYQHIAEDATLSMGIFRIPQGKQLPLHNHPHMTVLSRVLYGQLHIRAFDWTDPSADPLHAYQQPLPAKPVLDQTFEAGRDDLVVLRPRSGGNIHAFTAVTDCAVLDVLAPPYDLGDPDHDCTYFRARQGSHDEHVLLEACHPPASFKVKSETYCGSSVELEC